MPTSKVLSAIAATALLVSATSALAFNTLFMRDSVMSDMSDDEYEMMRQTFYSALDQEGSDTLSWNSPEGADGTVTPAERFEFKGYNCRKVSFENHKSGQTGQGMLNFCKDKDGNWKILSKSMRDQ
ncbi:MAG: hypothetical protein DHS20C01_29420 [marine bacterium B5-7]|nr:MAG: hypothetical protein DHS20C01_29420 [marine bacterium B5-7]